jgi:hypothetical protein
MLVLGFFVKESFLAKCDEVSLPISLVLHVNHELEF